MTVKTQKVTRLNDYSKNLRFPYSEPYLILIVCDENHVAQDASHVTQETRLTYWSCNLLLSNTVSSEC